MHLKETATKKCVSNFYGNWSDQGFRLQRELTSLKRNREKFALSIVVFFI